MTVEKRNEVGHISFLDCTLRDGGYQNNWLFSNSFIENYLRCMSQTPIQYVEIGQRSLDIANEFGSPYFSNQWLLNTARRILRSSQKIVMLVNGRDLGADMMDSIFFDVDFGLYDLVRVAITEKELAIKKPLLCDLALRVPLSVNIMRADSIASHRKIKNAVASIKPSFVYFADSFGAMFPADFEKLVSDYSSLGTSIGVHAHDNLGLAIANTHSAIKSGAKIVDFTVGGMGRGAGNCVGEIFLTSCKDLNLNDWQSYLNFAETDMKQLQSDFGWGTNSFYAIGSRNGEHPTVTFNKLSKTQTEEDVRDLLNKYIEKERSDNVDKIDMETGTLGCFDATDALQSQQVVIALALDQDKPYQDYVLKKQYGKHPKIFMDGKRGFVGDGRAYGVSSEKNHTISISEITEGGAVGNVNLPQQDQTKFMNVVLWLQKLNVKNVVLLGAVGTNQNFDSDMEKLSQIIGMKFTIVGPKMVNGHAFVNWYSV